VQARIVEIRIFAAKRSKPLSVQQKMKKLQKKILAVIAKCPHVHVWYHGDLFLGQQINLTVWNGEQQLFFNFYEFRKDVNERILFKFTELLTTMEELLTTMEEQQKGGAA
jgi:hypothetical protein